MEHPETGWKRIPKDPTDLSQTGSYVWGRIVAGPVLACSWVAAEPTETLAAPAVPLPGSVVQMMAVGIGCMVPAGSARLFILFNGVG